MGLRAGYGFNFADAGGGIPGTTTFTGLTDTPTAITANQFIRGNAGADALEFAAGRLLSNAQNTKLNGIDEGAEVNVQSDWDEADTTSDALHIQNKPVPSLMLLPVPAPLPP